jgi:hypothetical protein
VVLWSGGMDGRHQKMIIAAEGIGCEKGRLVGSLLKMKKREKSI